MSQTPPLLGDGHGRYYVHIVGNSGTGKSTLGAELASMLNVQHIALDTLHWNPNWTASTPEDFRAKVLSCLVENKHGWVVDGNYTRALQDTVTSRATDIIWLDPPFLLYFPRLLMRTFWRLIGRTPECAPGCPESPAEVFFSSKSIIYWAITNHSVVRRREREKMRTSSIEVGGIMRRIGGWGGELRRWKQAVAELVKAR